MLLKYIYSFTFFLITSSNVLSKDNLSGKQLLCKDDYEIGFEFLEGSSVIEYTYLGEGKYYKSSSEQYLYRTEPDEIIIFERHATWRDSIVINRTTLMLDGRFKCELTYKDLDYYFQKKKDKHFEGIEDKRKI